MTRLEIYTDGGSANVHDKKWQEKRRVASYGYIINNLSRLPVEGMGVSSVDPDVATSNFAEYSAILFAVDKLIDVGIGDTPIRIYCDSKMVVKMLKKEWGWKKLRWVPHNNYPHLEEILNTTLAALEEIEDWQIEWIPREKNREADALAEKARDQFAKDGSLKREIPNYKSDNKLL
jgi:ribonuclease HI